GLLLARDPLGKKPLYYGYDQHGHLCFASEIRCLIGHVARVQELPPGSYWRPGEGREPVRFYQVPRPVHRLREPREAVDLLERTLLEAVRKRLMADVPLGVFLSGGLDSSLISAMTRRMVRGELHSFAVGLEGSADLMNARQVARDIGTTHHERVLTPAEITAALPRVISQLESCDPALVRSAVPTYFVSEMASQYVKVVLSGEGADELFAGYQYLSEFTPDAAALSDELHLITVGLYNSNLQRVDRMTMAHGLEGRVPFLDPKMVDLAFRMDPSLKWRDGEGKWVLRKVAERYLRDSIVWRKKEKFAIGTGIGPLLESYADGNEERLYFSLFREPYGRPDVLAGMGRSRSLNPDQRWTSSL
ncbi:MAG TPA: asparagine synthase-related protein, partial [Symbiobacteriaceae bacterium]|nr:asparagine synthase-related protein [Symbiobacteriaceae bacterium]